MTGLDVSSLAKKLKDQPELFGKRTLRSDRYESPHKQMSDIWVRYNDYANLEKDPASFNDEHESKWYPEAERIEEVFGIAEILMNLVEGTRLGGVLITKIPPDGEIKPHIDTGWHAGFYEKFYVPIANKEGAVFGFIDGEIRPDIGDVYWFRNDVTHWVKNDSNEDRIALIVCIKTNLFKE